MALPVYEADDLAYHLGTTEENLAGYVDNALEQASFYVEELTEIRDWPSDNRMQKLLKYAILDVAAKLYMERLNFDVNSSPFQSETIGSYSYSVKSAASTQSIIAGTRPTGLPWLDLLLEALDKGPTTPPKISGGSISVMENDGVYIDEYGRKRLIGPAERSRRGWGDPDPSDDGHWHGYRYYRP